MSANGNNKRILIIENDDEMSCLLEEYIKEEYRIDSVCSFLEAIERISIKPVELIIIHIQTNSLQVKKNLILLRKYQPEVPIIIISDIKWEGSFQRSCEWGTSLVIKKPIDFEKLKLLIDDLIYSKSD